VSHGPFPPFTPHLLSQISSYIQRDKAGGFKSPQMGQRAWVILVLGDGKKEFCTEQKGRSFIPASPFSIRKNLPQNRRIT